MARPKGSKNFRTMEVEIIASKFALNPFEVLMMLANGDWKGLGFHSKTKIVVTAQGEFEQDNIPIEKRCDAAKEATKYLYTQKKSLTVSDPQGNAFRVIVEDYTK